MPFGATHFPTRSLAETALSSFFKEIIVLGSENVPEEGPMLVACSHTNMVIDPAVLSNTIPRKVPLHYWVKDSLFANPVLSRILINAGNIPVDRRNKNNQSLFKGTFEVMALGESIGVFPEGTSHTSPHLLPLKDGVSWAALEYVKYLAGAADGVKKKGRKAVIVPVGITYLDKAKYRSSIIVEYGQPITMDAFEQQFLSAEEGANKIAVKRLTKTLELEMMKLTVNAPDWESLIAAKMAKELLWEKESKLAPEEVVKVQQTLVDMFSPPTTSKQLQELKDLLNKYNNLLVTAKLSNTELSDLPLPESLNPSRSTPLPTKFATIWLLIKDTISCMVRLPFFLVPMVVHLPIYVMARMGANIAKEELETQAQMKVAFGLLFSFAVYPVIFFALWVLLGFTALGGLVAAALVYGFNMSHQSLVDANYSHFKRLVAAWRVIVGVWAPKRREIPIAKLASVLPSSSAPEGATKNAYAWKTRGTDQEVKEEVEKTEKRKRVPTRRFIKHVLRTRVAAAQALEAFLAELEQGGHRVNARPWLVEAAPYGAEAAQAEQQSTADEGKDAVDRFPMGTRAGEEVVEFLRQRGARILPSTSEHTGWDALSGDETEARSGNEE
ncbi:hypothetical protein NliqN6_2087 [Naganishia liquefaciens]|uniref:Phospholipid/glycerol acyltransferase domain-containing protein n=1 Tax=Naganishia liquefaciens TaxID=104408 RepID=A0A8H3TR57_9TREE|nr:hypothetical protein NliqN6_2087 [Naganishia liquefaciens]